MLHRLSSKDAKHLGLILHTSGLIQRELKEDILLDQSVIYAQGIPEGMKSAWDKQEVTSRRLRLRSNYLL